MDLLVGVERFIQKDFVRTYAYSEIIYYLNKPSQGVTSAEVVSEAVDGQKNIKSAGRLCSQWMGSRLRNLIPFFTPLTSPWHPEKVLIQQNNKTFTEVPLNYTHCMLTFRIHY